jgi:hypothetical protein
MELGMVIDIRNIKTKSSFTVMEVVLCNGFPGSICQAYFLDFDEGFANAPDGRDRSSIIDFSISPVSDKGRDSGIGPVTLERTKNKPLPSLHDGWLEDRERRRERSILSAIIQDPAAVSRIDPFIEVCAPYFVHVASRS